MAYEQVGMKHEEDGVVLLSLKNPPVNALSVKLMEDLEGAIAEIAKDRSKRAVILTGDGQYFSAGADLKEMASMADSFKEQAPKIVARGHKILRSLESMPQPVIAAINGLAVGGGLELALACDIRIAGDSAKLGAPEVQYGLIPAYGGTNRLTRLVGTGKARELIFTGAMIGAAEALKIGLVNKTVAAGQELRAARDVAHTIAQKAPLAVAAAKASILHTSDVTLDEGLEFESQQFVKHVVGSEDLLEGIVAFVERRPPKFQGK